MKSMLPLAVLTAALATGCTASPEEGGIPGPSWFTASRDGTLNPKAAAGRVSEPNSRRGGPPDTWSPRKDVLERTGPGTTPTPNSPQSSTYPYNNFPYNVGREPLPASALTIEEITPPGNTTATVYPDRAEAARSANSPALYPPTGRINPDPHRNPTLYPKNLPGGRGFVGP